MKFVSEPKQLSLNLLPGKVVSISVGENTCAAVTGKLLFTPYVLKRCKLWVLSVFCLYSGFFLVEDLCLILAYTGTNITS